MTRVIFSVQTGAGRDERGVRRGLGISAWGEPRPGRGIRSCELSFRKGRRAVVDSFKVALYEVMTEVMTSFF